MHCVLLIHPASSDRFRRLSLLRSPHVLDMVFFKKLISSMILDLNKNLHIIDLVIISSVGVSSDFSDWFMWPDGCIFFLLSFSPAESMHAVQNRGLELSLKMHYCTQILNIFPSLEWMEFRYQSLDVAQVDFFTSQVVNKPFLSALIGKLQCRRRRSSSCPPGFCSKSLCIFCHHIMCWSSLAEARNKGLS